MNRILDWARLRKRVTVAALGLVVCSFGLARAQEFEVPVRIACVGDSITEGTANADHAINSWPSILARMLDAEFPGRFETGNYGRSGATLLKGGGKPYWNQDVFANGGAYRPGIVIINLGTNDATNANWLKHGDEFENDYRNLIEHYRALDTKPTIWLSNLTPMYEPHPRVAECEPHRAEIEDIIRKLASEYKLGVVDFKYVTAGKPELFPDGLHPNTAGNELMAKAAFEALTRRPAPDDQTIRPQGVSGDRHDLVSDGQGVGVRLGSWTQSSEWVKGTGAKREVLSKVGLGEGDFHIRARLRMLGQKNSAAGFLINGNFFGFEGARGTVFRNGPQMGGLRMLHPAGLIWDRDLWIDFEVVRNSGMVWFIVNGFVVDMASIPGAIERFGFDPTRSTMQISDWSVVGTVETKRPEHMIARTKATPWIDLSRRSDLRTIVDREPGRYLGQPDTLLLADNRTIICAYPRGHGGPGTYLKVSRDGGSSWSARIQTPENFTDKHNAPTLHRVIDPRSGVERLIMFVSHPVMKLSVSEDDGETWSPYRTLFHETLKGVPGYTGHAPPKSVIRRNDGSYFALYHDHVGQGIVPIQIESVDGGLTWNTPKIVGDWSAFPGAKPCEPTVIRSPNGKQLLCLLRENSRKHNSLAMTSNDEGRTWSPMFELPASLTGDRHVGAYLPDNRLLVTFRDMHQSSPTYGDFVAWVGTYQDLIEQREGQFTCRLLDNRGEPGDTGYAGLEVLADGTIVSTSYCRLQKNEEPVIVSVRYMLEDLVELLPTKAFGIPLIDLDGDEGRHFLVDREQGQYLGHVTTTLLEDGKTILAVYPKGHGRGPIVYKRSEDAGLTWSDRLPTPENWATSKEVPTIHSMIDPKTGDKRLIIWSGLYPARLATSEDDGESWSELKPVGEWGGIVVMGFVERLNDGSYMAMFHDDGRFFTSKSQHVNPPVFTLYKTFSHDGGLTWTHPKAVLADTEVHLCEPGCIRSPDGKTLAVLLRENSRTRNSHVIFSEDEGVTWSAPRELPASLTGDRHTGKYAPDGRLFISFRDTALESPTKGDWVGWVGTWEDILYGRPGQYRVRIKDNKNRWDTTYPGVEVLADGAYVVTTYGHWDAGEQPYILSARFTLEELDEKASLLPKRTDLFAPGMNGVHTYRIPALVTTNKGTLIASCDARNRSGRDLPNNIDTVIRRSTDGGRTWSDIQTIVDWEGSEGAADPCLLVDRQTGRIWCAVTWADGVGWRNSKPGFGADSFHDLLLFSDDDGLTWSDPIDITKSLKDPSWRSVWFGPGAGIQSASGRLFIPFSVADGDGVMFTYAAVSDDHGESWQRVGPMGTKTNESMLAQLGDGTIVCNMRSKHGLRRRAISRSMDDGETWTPLTHDDELVEPVCQGSVLTISPSQTPDGREWLVFCNPASTSRNTMTVRVSFDGGETWPIARLIHAGPASYSCMTILPDGSIGVLYENGLVGSAERITFARLPLEWLVEGDSK